MSSSYLWATSVNGGVYQLSDKKTAWDQIIGRGVEVKTFKKVCALESCGWALGSDSNIYIYVKSADVPIRCQVVTYENQRWTPMRGFSNLLLPSDRYGFSSKDGKVHLSKEGFHLPSDYWDWEADWIIDENIEGEVTDKEGWQYAVDFPAKYRPQKKLTSCVRRRRWIRHRRYIALDTWAKIPALHADDPVIEPFVDVGIGGQNLPNVSPGHVSVWAVTVVGKVYVRTNVCSQNPEGDEWSQVEVEKSIQSLSVGPLGQVWALTWTGKCLIRQSVSWENVHGTSWTEIEQPDIEDSLLQVSVGIHAVWAVSRSGKVWFRRGVDARNEYSITGTGWINMVGEMSSLSVGIHDQVWGVGLCDSKIYLRMGVSSSELSGKTWQPMISHSLNRNLSFSISLDSSSYLSEDTNSIRSLNVSEQTSREHTPDNVDGALPLFSNLSLTPTTEGPEQLKSLDTEDYQFLSISSLNSLESKIARRQKTIQEIKENKLQRSRSSSFSSTASDTVVDFVNDFDEEAVENFNETDKEISVDETNKEISTEQGNDSSKQPEDIIEHTIVPTEELNDSNSSVVNPSSASDNTNIQTIQSNAESHHDIVEPSNTAFDTASIDTVSSLNVENSMLSVYFNEDYEASELKWMHISSMACYADTNVINNWFQTKVRDSRIRNKMKEMGTWRKKILQFLKLRDNEMSKFKGYELAIERTSWKKTGIMQFLKEDGAQRWTECSVELQRYDEEEGSDGTFILQYIYHGQHKTVQIQLSDIVCTYRIADVTESKSSACMLAIYTPGRLERFSPLKLTTRTEDDLADWAVSLSTLCCNRRGIYGPASQHAAWAITCKGDVFLNDPVTEPIDSVPANTVFWHQFGGHLKKVESNSLGITWGIGHDHTAWVYTASYGGGMFKGLASSTVGINTQSDIINVYIYENQRWNPLTGYSTTGLPSDRPMWSNKSGKQGLSKEKMELPSKHGQWVSDWVIDYHPPHGADKKGWQYATDFPAKYSETKGVHSFVRRRRWVRKCQITTSGPWQEVPPHLLDVSIQVDPRNKSGAAISLWAVDTSGNVLCRYGVTKDNPEGTHWKHIATDHLCHSVSVGANGRVWALGRESSAWLRNGISKTNMSGTGWIQITPPPPNNAKLRQISVGGMSVWAVDNKNNLWFRQDITPTFPEGTAWIMVCPKVKTVSVGVNNQVWITAKSLDAKESHGISGIVCRRKGITDDDRLGYGWDFGIGGGWEYVCIRGCTTEKK